MRSDTQYLLDISAPSKEFDAVRFVEEYIHHEVEQLRHCSIYSSIHNYVTEHGYPVPREQIEKSSYLNRDKLENRVGETIARGDNLYLVGCEGSGKTTLLHFVISSRFDTFNALFCYVDISDIGADASTFSDMLYDKFRNALFVALPPALRAEFIRWVDKFRNDPFANDLVNTTTTKRFVEAILIFLNAHPALKNVYILIDNVDSIKSRTVEEFFATLHLLEAATASAFHTIPDQNHDRVRFIISCRTQSIEVVTSASRGLFTKAPFTTIDMDERFVAETDILALTRSFVKKEARLVRAAPASGVRVSAGGWSAEWPTFDDYCEDVFDWLERSSEGVNQTVKNFCGRSIRRSKLFLLKTLASPIIARLVFFEKHKVVYNIVRDDPEYLKRRMLEALFDFWTSRTLQLSGYPLNPFNVLRDRRTFRLNPLIGVVALLYLEEHKEELRLDDVHFAQAISIEPLLTLLRSMRYDDEAIAECVQSFVLCGMIRPINGSQELLQIGEHAVVDRYILDEQSLKIYADLILCKRWTAWLQFYNGALRARYKIRGDRHIDNMAYEVMTFLVFLFDLLEREQALEEQLRDSGIMFKPLSARIRHTVFAVLSGELQNPPGSRRRKTTNLEREQTELTTRTQEMLQEARWRLSRHPGII